jgi:hypothetical protein
VAARPLRARYEPVPTGWDALFKDLGSCYVRMRLKSGLWVGGWWGGGSHASSYPQEADMYLERQATRATLPRHAPRMFPRRHRVARDTRPVPRNSSVS